MATRPLPFVPREEKPRPARVIQYPGNGVAGGLAAVTRDPLALGEVIRDLNILVVGDVTVAGGLADGALSPEQPLSLIRDLQIVGTSRTRPQVGQIKRSEVGALFQYLAMMKGTPGNRVNLAIPGLQAATPFLFDLEVDFELPRAIDPRMTLLNTMELQTLDLLIQWEDRNGLINGGDRVVTINNCTATVQAREFVDDVTKAGTYGIHRFDFIEQAITAANAAFPIDIRRGFFLRGLLIKQFTQAPGVNFHTPVATVVTGAIQVSINRNPVLLYNSWAHLVSENKLTYGLEALPLGYAFIDFFTEGKLDTLIDTRIIESVELILGVAAPANARLRVYPVELIPARR